MKTSEICLAVALDEARPFPMLKPHLRKATPDGRKTVTRRVVKPKHGGVVTSVNPDGMPIELWGGGRGFNKSRSEVMQCPYGKVGDFCYIREPLERWADVVQYADDSEQTDIEWTWKTDKLSQMLMPKRFARYFVRLIEITAERIQDITEEEIEAEGVQHASWCSPTPASYDSDGVCIEPGGCTCEDLSYHEVFEETWQKINGHRDGCSWSDNPWVWVVRFELVRMRGTKE